MLRLEGIVKNYESAEISVPALKDVNLNFRQSEFVSILGPSGCGKTTLLNIIGGLDRYTSGDLIIQGKSTKEYTDKDWDSYRNHTIGFVFQNYNLIMHLNILDNVEMALTLAGLSREDRKTKAIEALKSVGLEDHLHKKPNQLSGGQMQRVAIARAIVNNPKIILADEPTGALDTETSVQIMDILKELSKDKLIIMVTHNPDLAKTYSTRIINLLDGVVQNDSLTYTADDEKLERVENESACQEVENLSSQDKEIENAKVDNEQIVAEDVDKNLQTEIGEKSKKTAKNKGKGHVKKEERTSMSFFTALKLSLQNLRTKKARTILTSIAGSIGIIGVALILALSNGFQTYVDKMQMDTLSGFPLTIEQNATDYSALEGAFMDSNGGKNVKKDKIYVNKILEKLLTAQRNNNITEEYVNSAVKTIDKSLYYDIQYKKDFSLNVYKYVKGYGNMDVNKSLFEMGTFSYNLWSEMVDNKNFIDKQYELVYGKFPETPENDGDAHEVVIVLNKQNQISDAVLLALGLIDSPYKYMSDADYRETFANSISYDNIINQEFKLIMNDDLYNPTKDDGDNIIGYNKISPVPASIYNNGLTLKIVGVLKLNDESSMDSITGNIAYLSSLREYVMEKEQNSAVVNFYNQKIEWYTENLAKDVSERDVYFSGMTDEDIKQGIEDYKSLLKKVNGDNSIVGINIYPVDFASKEKIKAHLDAYNDTIENEDDKVYYTDLMEIMVSTVNTVISAISYILIAFTSIALVVSSLMIGIITYVSVLERIKEIGILRSIGARKKDISRVFNAETLIIGFCAGLIGVVTTVILSVPINIILYSLIEIDGVAALPPLSAIALIMISMGLTLISGLIPARIASKKDPVIALRSE